MAEYCLNGISRRIAGVLSSEEIKKYGLIVSPRDGHFGQTVYDLSLGDYHYVYEMSENQPGKTTRIPVCTGEYQEMKEENERGEEKFVRQTHFHEYKALKIPALGTALIQLDEIVDTLTIAERENVLVTGRFDLRLELVNRGLVSQQGTQVEPCYRGRLYCFIHNFSNSDVFLEKHKKKKIASIEFSYISCFCSEDKRKAIKDELISSNINRKRYEKQHGCDPGKGILNIRYFSNRSDIMLPEAGGLISASNKAASDAKDAVLDDKNIDSILNKVLDDGNLDKISDKLNIKSKHIIMKALISPLIVTIITALLTYILSIKPMKIEIKNCKENITKCEDRIMRLESHILK